MNLYRYCRNNPIVTTDAFGEQAPITIGNPFPHGPNDPVIGNPTADPTQIKATLEAVYMIIQWITGTGPTFPKYGDDSAMVELLKKNPRVETARAKFCAQNAGKPRSEWVSIDYSDKFTLKQYWEYNVNPLHVLGSITIEITSGVTISPHEGPTGGNTPGWSMPSNVFDFTLLTPELETITVYNDMHWESAWRFLVYLGTGEAPMGRSWERADYRFFGTVHQAFRWQENVLD